MAHSSQQYLSRRSPSYSDDEESDGGSVGRSLVAVPLGHNDYDSSTSADGHQRHNYQKQQQQQHPNGATTPTSPNGELFVTIVSAVLLFSHFGITLYKIEKDHPETSLGKQHLKDRWMLINVCILVFALASHMYRQALSNLSIKFAPIVLVPDFCTTGVVFLILTKHIYFALYLLMAGVTYLSVTVTMCDMYAYCNPNKTVSGTKELQRTGEHKKEDIESEQGMDTSLRSTTSVASSTLSVTSSYSRRGSLASVNMTSSGVGVGSGTGSGGSIVHQGDCSSVIHKTGPRKKATRSILKKDTSTTSLASSTNKRGSLW